MCDGTLTVCICLESAAFIDKKMYSERISTHYCCSTEEICKCAQIKDQTTHWHLIYENCLYHTFFTCIYALRPLYLCYKYIHFFIFLKPNNDNSFMIPLWIMKYCMRYQDICQAHFFFLKPKVIIL